MDPTEHLLEDIASIDSWHRLHMENRGTTQTTLLGKNPHGYILITQTVVDNGPLHDEVYRIQELAYDATGNEVSYHRVGNNGTQLDDGDPLAYHAYLDACKKSD
jgi:hypothetical protein